MKKIIFPIVLVLIIAVSLSAQAAKLNLGDKAPPMKISKWVKGAPVRQFVKDNVYVVEFWASWCGPCQVTIPHLTQLAEKYKNKVTIVGVNVWDNTDIKTQAEYNAKITKFVNEQGDKMVYSVGLDDMKNTMAKTWMEAAEAQGIPTAFVIGKDGKIAAIVHPMEIEHIVDQVLADKFDIEKYKNEREFAAKMAELTEPIYQLFYEEKFKEAVEEIDKLLVEHPKAERDLGFPKFYALSTYDAEKSYAFAKELAEGVYKEEAMALIAIASRTLDINPEKPNSKLALELAEKAKNLTKEEDYYLLDGLGEIYFKNGDVDKAIEYEQAALDLIKKDEFADASFKPVIEENLERYKDAKSNK